MFLYFIRVKDQFINAFEEKLIKISEVRRVQQVSVLGNPAKAEAGYRMPATGGHNTMLIVLVREQGCVQVEGLLKASSTFGMHFHSEHYEVVEK